MAMKKSILLFTIVLSTSVFAQDMTNEKLQEIYTSVSDSIQGQTGTWQFHVKDVTMVSITDISHNRMRIISPIVEVASLKEDLLKAALMANFHTALDVKYAIADGILWSIFVHPLKELSEDQVRDALSQVYYANVNFGSTYASTSLVFPGSENKGGEKKKAEPVFKKRKI